MPEQTPVVEGTAQRLDELQRLAEAATTGPWEIYGDRDYELSIGHPKGAGRLDVVSSGYEGDGGCDLADAEFIAAAREAVPWLIGLVRGQADALQAALGECHCGSGGEPGYEGPQEDCEVHGERRHVLIAQRDEARSALQAATDERDGWKRTADMRSNTAATKRAIEAEETLAEVREQYDVAAPYYPMYHEAKQDLDHAHEALQQVSDAAVKHCALVYHTNNDVAIERSADNLERLARELVAALGVGVPDEPTCEHGRTVPHKRVHGMGLGGLPDCAGPVTSVDPPTTEQHK